MATPSAPYIGMHVTRYECPNWRCRQRHWILIYRLRLIPRLRLELVDIVRSFGPTPEDLRVSLRSIASIDDETVELIVAAAALTPERV